MHEFVATLVAAKNAVLSADVVLETARHLRASSYSWLGEEKAADVFFNVLPEQNMDMEGAYISLRQRLKELPVDCIVQPVSTRRKRLLIADMESTIIEQEMLDELADFAGAREKVADITRRAMNGELDFAQALRERVRIIKSLPESALDVLAKRAGIMPGATELISTMRANGGTCWLATGGFSCFAEPIAKNLGFDAFFANKLVVRDGVIAGEVAEPILDKNFKKTLLKKAQEELGLSLSEMLAVGDGANDEPMLSAANAGGGLGIAYRAKPNVRALVLPQINHGDLTGLLYAQGYEKKEFSRSFAVPNL